MYDSNINPENKVVFGLFRTRRELENCVSHLKAENFRNTDISVIFPQQNESTSFAVEAGTKAPEGAAIGTGAGAVLGGALGWLVGAGVIATMPALGALVAAGPIMGTLAGLGVGGAVGGISGALIGTGIPDYEAERYEAEIQNGGMLILVHADDQEWADKAEAILEECDALDISRTTETMAHRNIASDYMTP